MKNSFSLKAGALLTTAFGIILVSGSTGDLVFAKRHHSCGLQDGRVST